MTEHILDHRKYHFETVTIDGVECEVAYLKKFKVAWFFCQLNLFVFIRKTDETIDKKMIESFSRSCYNYAIKNNRGLPRGLQSAVGSIAIIKGKNPDKSAVDYCHSKLNKHWSAFEIPVVYDTEKSIRHRFKHKPAWGYVFFPYLARVVDEMDL